MIKRRVERLEEVKEAEQPYYFESPVLIELCAEMGVPPYMYPVKPKDMDAYMHEVTKAYLK